MTPPQELEPSRPALYATVQVVLVRAEDIAALNVIRLPGEKRWRTVYDAANKGYEGDTDEVIELFQEEIDSRYVVLRVSDDPPMMVGTQWDNGKLHTWISGGNTMGGKPTEYGAPVEYNDRIVILDADELVEAQHRTVHIDLTTKPEEGEST